MVSNVNRGSKLMSDAGASISSEAMMHCPVWDLPPISEKCFGLRGKFSQFDLFQENFSIFNHQTFWRPFFLKLLMKTLEFPPIFPVSIYSPPILRNSSFPTFPISHWFRKIYVFLHSLCFSFPPTLTMMHLCITQCTYWTPLVKWVVHQGYSLFILNIPLSSVSKLEKGIHKPN